MAKGITSIRILQIDGKVLFLYGDTNATAQILSGTDDDDTQYTALCCEIDQNVDLSKDTVTLLLKDGIPKKAIFLCENREE